MQQQKALEYFKSNYNCAQSIIKAFADDSEEHSIEDFVRSGGGRAAEGMCGALYAAVHLLDEEKSKILKKDFAKLTGSEKCREIKSIKKASCSDCVKIAAEMLLKLKNS